MECAPGEDPAAWSAALESLPERIAEGKILQTGRNRVIRCGMQVGDQLLDVVVKEFSSRPGLLRILLPWRPGKARRAWETACGLTAAGVGTPPPLALLETASPEAGTRADYLFTAFVPGLLSLREALQDVYLNRPRSADLMALLRAVAAASRRLHDAGWIHYDMGNQNLLLPAGRPPGADAVLFVDLNRSRRIRPTLRRVARDLSRLSLPSDFRRILQEMYFDGPRPPAFRRWERISRAWFACHTWSRRWRHPLRERLRPAEPSDPPPRDIWIWDEASSQAISAWTSRDRRRLHCRTDGVRMAAAVARRARAVLAAYRDGRARAYREPVALAGRIGVAVQMDRETEERERAFLEPLGKLPVLLRACHHETEAQWEWRAGAARRLAEAGHEVTLALVQDRIAVLDPARWREFVLRMLESCGESLAAVELGHAVNRVKWGVWSLAEYRRWCAAVSDVPGRYGRIQWLGPATIDFEYHRTLAFLAARPEGLEFSALSHHLYVDRRGAPETPQGPFSALEKAALARAVAETVPGCGGRLVVTEFNWPLAGTGIHSPVCSPYLYPGQEVATNVTEDAAARYLARYLLMTVCSGMADRVFWWRLAARGFGLVDDTDPGSWRIRPAYEVLRDMLSHLGSAACTGRPRTPPGVHAFEFTQGGRRHWLVYAHPRPCVYEPPVRWRAAWALPGGRREPAPGPLTLTGVPWLLLDVEGGGAWENPPSRE